MAERGTAGEVATKVARAVGSRAAARVAARKVAREVARMSETRQQLQLLPGQAAREVAMEEAQSS